jgi:parallel beta-helix repeat protein
MNNLVEESDVGIHLVGEENNSLVLQNTISKCNIGLKLGIGVKCEITGNLIS